MAVPSCVDGVLFLKRERGRSNSAVPARRPKINGHQYGLVPFSQNAFHIHDLQTLSVCHDCLAFAMASTTILLEQRCLSSGATIVPKQASPQRAIVRKHKCGSCQTRFSDLITLQVHQKKTGHCYCPTCNKSFKSPQRHLIHARTLSHGDIIQCCDCDRKFTDQESLTTHCCLCNRIFKTENGLAQHVATNQLHKLREQHLKPRKTINRYQCSICSVGFHNKDSADKHEREKHGPERTIQCPAKPKCGRTFASPSALFGHLESGSCESGMNRQKLNDLVVEQDRERYITYEDPVKGLRDPSFKIESSPAVEVPPPEAETEADLDWVMLSSPLQDHKESDIRSVKQEISNLGTEEYELVNSVPQSPSIGPNAFEWSLVSSQRFWVNGSVEHSPYFAVKPPASPAYTTSPRFWVKENDEMVDSKRLPTQRPPSSGMHTCHMCYREFRSANALKSHSASAVHASKIFHCPVSFASHLKENLLPQKKEKRFSTLSGLTQHLEAGACQGGIETFRNVIGFAQDRLSDLGVNRLKLLAEQE